ncbi:unnamed protein product, partial [Didymodactylos carnosus]
DSIEIKDRVNEFERSNNIRRFYYDTPVTLDGTKGHTQQIEQQCKIRTILTTSHSFPYVKKRIEIIDQIELHLSPLETALDEIRTKNSEIRAILNEEPIRIVMIQLLLAGSVQPQVNVGVMAYAQAFLDETKVKYYNQKLINQLKNELSDFLCLCNDLIIVHERECTADQRTYHQTLVEAKMNLNDLLKPFLDNVDNLDQMLLSSKLTLFNSESDYTTA